MRKIIISLMLTLTAFIANAQPSAIAPRDYQRANIFTAVSE